MPNKQTYYRKTLALYWSFTRQFPGSIALGFLIIPQNIVANIATPFVIAQIVGNLAAGNTDTSLYLRLIGYLLVLQLVSPVLNHLAVRGLVKLQMDGIKLMEQYMIKKLHTHSYSFYTNNFAGSIVNDYTKFFGGYAGVTDAFFATFLGFLTNFGFSVAVLFYYSKPIAIVFGVLAAVFMIVNFFQVKARIPLRIRANETASEKIGQLADMMSNMLTVKTFAKEQYELDNYRTYIEKSGEATKANWLRAASNAFVVLLSSGLLLTLTVALAVSGVLNKTVGIAVIILVQAYAFRMTNSIFELSKVVKNFEQGMGDAFPMTARLLSQPDVKDKPGAKSFRPESGKIEFRNVGFTYKENKQNKLFEDFSLIIKAGEKIGLVGHSGSGKTTLTKLLLRFMDLKEGHILFDGVDITDIKQSSVRNAIAYVPQEPLMFHRSIRDNIRYGNTRATDKQVQEAAQLAHATEFIEKLPNNYETFVGERGMKLSGGQRQRIAIARAMLKDAPIIVLDEATSALDSESERLIQDALSKLMEHKTAIVIAHRLSTIQKMDRIVLLEDGKIQEIGSHATLLKENGTYARLWKHQSGGFLDD